MFPTSKPFMSLTARDLMTREVEAIPREMSLKAAAHRLSQARISGAPVVDADGKCIGVLSATDFVRWADEPVENLPMSPGCVHSAWQLLDGATMPAEEVGR